jgi:hypothetical protein
MLLVDTHIVAYLLIDGDHTDGAHQLHLHDATGRALLVRRMPIIRLTERKRNERSL